MTSPPPVRIKDRLASCDSPRRATGTDSSSGLTGAEGGGVWIVGPLQADKHADKATRKTTESRQIADNVIVRSYVRIHLTAIAAGATRPVLCRRYSHSNRREPGAW